MPELLARLDARRPGGDRAFARQAAAAVVAAVALAPLFACAAQVLVERAAGALVGPDVAIDRLMADGELAVAPQPASHLLRAPIFPQQHLDPCPLGGRELLIAAGGRASAAGGPNGERGAGGAVAVGAISPGLPPNGAPVAPQRAGERGGG